MARKNNPQKAALREVMRDYLKIMDITKKWTGPRQEWRQIHSQLEIYFEERLEDRNLESV